MRLVTGPALIGALFASPVWAQDLDLSLPVDCAIGQDCYIQNHVDRDPGPGVRDAGCGALTYDGHDGTDFALPTTADLTRNVAVLAALQGVVAGVRDGMPDIAQGGPDSPDVTGQECGNGVLVSHVGGWETQYCHLAEGSIRVAHGDIVGGGTVLGHIGLSGLTEFPHLHFTLRRDGRAVDPFNPATDDTCGSGDDPLPPETLWAAPVPYVPGGVTAVGWADAVPAYADVRAGTADTAVTRDTALVFWGLLFGAEAGDTIHITVHGPDGTLVVDHLATQDRRQAILFQAAGRRGAGGGWQPGDYVGEIILMRGETVIDRMTGVLTID